MTRDVTQEEVGIEPGGAEEEGSDETHDDGIPRPTRPHIHQGHIIGMYDDLFVSEVVGPSEKGYEQSQ